MDVRDRIKNLELLQDALEAWDDICRDLYGSDYIEAFWDRADCLSYTTYKEAGLTLRALKGTWD